MASRVSSEGQVHAIMAVDPGGTTGVAACHLRLAGTLKETLLGATKKKAIEVEGSWYDQGRVIAGYMNNFTYTANVECSIPMDHIHFVFEDFVLRLPANTTNLTSIWVAASAVTAYGPTLMPIRWQQASTAKGFATNSRLKLWGLWEIGSEHKRDAWRHLACLANTVVD